SDWRPESPSAPWARASCGCASPVPCRAWRRRWRACTASSAERGFDGRSRCGNTAVGRTWDMKVVITGGGGFLGRKLAARLLQAGTLAGPGGSQQKIEHLVLFDQVEPPPELASDPRVAVVVGDVADRDTVDRVIGN